MHKLNVKNKELVPMLNLLAKMDLKNAKSRARTKTMKVIKKAIEELSDSETDLFKDYCELDENGNLKKNEQNNFIPIPEKKDELDAAHNELLNEVVVLEGGQFVHNLDLIPDILANLNMDLSGEDAEIYDRLCDEFDNWNEPDTAVEVSATDNEEA